MEITNKHLHPIRKRISVVCGSFLPCQGWLPITSNTKCKRTPPPTKPERLSYLQPKKTFSNWNLVLRNSLQAVYLTKVLPFQLWEQCKTLTIPVVKGIIAPVPFGTAVEWCSPMVFVCKKMEHPVVLLIYKSSMHNALQNPAIVLQPSNLLLKFYKMSRKLYWCCRQISCYSFTPR